jgi:hypothetical protein
MILYFVLPELFSETKVTFLYVVLSVPLSQYCTSSLRYHIVLFSIIMLYFHPSQYCTSRRYYVVFSIIAHIHAKLWGAYNFLNWVFILFVLSVMYFWYYNVVLPVIKVVLYIFTRDRVYSPRLDICTSCLYSCILLFPLWQSFFMQNYERPCVLL